MTDPGTLNARQQRLVELVATGIPVQQAAQQAGFSPSYARKASKLLKLPAIATAVADIRERGRSLAAYNLATAMREAQEVIDFAKKHKNSMAYFKAVQHRADLSGLLLQRVEISTVDLAGSLQRARSRVIDVLNVTPRQPCEDGLAVQGGARWNTRLAGDPAPSDPERACPSQAGQAD